MSEITVHSVKPMGVALPKTDKSAKRTLENISFEHKTEKKEKKNHTLLKIAIGTVVAIGTYLLLKRTGKGAKIKDYAVKLKDKLNQLIKGGEKVVETASTEGTQIVTAGENTLDKAAQKAKNIAESINKPFTTSAQTIDANLGIDAVTKSAQESASVFEQAGLTSTEKALQKVEQQAVKNTRYPYYYVDKYEADMAQKLKAQQIEEMWNNYYRYE